MQVPKWLKPGVWGVVIGVVALAFLGFTFFGWVTGGTAEQMANDRAQTAVVDALVPVCIMQATSDPRYSVRVAALKKGNYWDGYEKVAKFGWATMPGSDEPRRSIAEECARKLLTDTKR